MSSTRRKLQMRKLTTTAIAAACLMLGAGGARAGTVVYDVFENHVTDEAAYKEALPEVQKLIKEAGGEYIAGGFNKAKLHMGEPAIGNRFVIIRFPDMAAWEKSQSSGVKAWLTKHAPKAREIIVESVE
jgi:uncharacterized protein (DUF1330 family)